MKMYMILLAAVMGVGLLGSCTDAEEKLEQQVEKDRSRELFCQAEEIGVYRAGDPLWIFDGSKQQLAMHESGNDIRLYVESDDEKQSVCFLLPAMVKNSEPGTNVQIHLSCRYVEQLTPGASPMEIVRRDTNGEFPKVWLWNETSGTGFILYTDLQ